MAYDPLGPTSNVGTLINGKTFQFSTVNSSTVNLTAGATFIGTIEAVLNQAAFSILGFSDQNGTLVVRQYTDLSGTKLNQTLTFPITASQGFARSGVLNGNYIQVLFTNNGGVSTTNFQLDTAYGDILPATQSNNVPVEINQETASGNITIINSNPATGVATANSTVELQLNGNVGLGVQVTGTYTGALSLQLSLDNTNWITVGGTPFVNVNTGVYSANIASASIGIFQSEVGGAFKARITALGAMTGTATVSMRAISNTALVDLGNALPTGANTIGNIGTLATLSGGQTAHSSPSTGNPLRIAGRVAPTTIATVDTTLVAGDASELAVTTAMQGVMKLNSSSELDFHINFNTAGTVLTVQPLVPASGTASVRNYISSVTLSTDTLGTAGLAWILDSAIAGASATIGATATFTNTGSNDLKNGDSIVFTSIGTITGIAVNTVYWVVGTPSATTMQIATTLGGTALTTTGTTSAYTCYRVLHQFKLQTTAINIPTEIYFVQSLKGIANTLCNFLIPTTLTSGSVYLSVNGYRGF